MNLPAPHGDKLDALLANEKLPVDHQGRVKDAVRRYREWLNDIAEADGDNLGELTRLLSDYRLSIDLNLVFDSPNDFLYRQKGQLKLDNTVIEEFLPLLVSKVFPALADQFEIGPRPCFSGVSFSSTLRRASVPGIRFRSKDQDFTIARRLYVKASFDPDLDRNTDAVDTFVGYVCAECKTNLDKTMFQEATATAHDLKVGVPGATYLLLCEWLDMKPVSIVGTDIDTVMILRKAKRLGSQVRARFSTSAGRRAARAEYADFLRKHPFAEDVFERFLNRIRTLLEDRQPDERAVLDQGYF